MLEEKIERLTKEYDALLDRCNELYLSGNQSEADRLYKEEACPLVRKIANLQSKLIKEILG